MIIIDDCINWIGILMEQHGLSEKVKSEIIQMQKLIYIEVI